MGSSINHLLHLIDTRNVEEMTSYLVSVTAVEPPSLSPKKIGVCLEYATRQGWAEGLPLLMVHSDRHSVGRALARAVDCEHLNCIVVLAPAAPEKNLHRLERKVVEAGRTQMIKALMPHTTQEIAEEIVVRALESVLDQSNALLLKTLFDHPRVSVHLPAALPEHLIKSRNQWLMKNYDAIYAEHTNQVLSENVNLTDTSVSGRPNRKI